MKILGKWITALVTAFSSWGCIDRDALAEMSFGSVNDQHAKASPDNVISMGRDDEEGQAKKWHIGGGED